MPFDFDNYNELPFNTLKGKTITEIIMSKDIPVDEIIFITDNGVFKLFHNQGCCESVDLYDVVGKFEDLIGHPLLVAEESSTEHNRDEVTPWSANMTDEELDAYYSQPDSWTWTYYKLATIKGFVDMRWYGSSNGYYSERVSLVGLEQDGSQ